MLWSILSLIVVSLLCGRRGMKAAFLLGRSLSRRQKAELGFIRGTTPCHATLTETLRVIDAQALADVLGALFLEEGGNARHIAIDGKTMRASKDTEGKAEHVLSAFCSSLQTVLGHEASRSKGLRAEAPGAARLEGQDRHRGRNLLPEIDRCENRRTRRRLCLSGQGQSEDATPGHRNGFQRAGFSPCAHGIAVSKRRMGASNGARSTCFLPKPPGFRASGRRFGKSAASSVRAKSRRTASGRRHSTSSSIWFPACPPPPRHRLCWASIAIIGGSRSCIETTT